MNPDELENLFEEIELSTKIHNAHLLGHEDCALEAEVKVAAYYDELRSREHLLLNLPIKIGIQGPGRSGKDTAADWLLANTMLKFAGTTSIVISRQIAFEDNITFEEAHDKRHAQRERWRAKGDWMRRHNPAKLAIYTSIGSNIVAGVRARVEMVGILNLGILDINYWIDKPDLPVDPTLEFGSELCHAIVPNHEGVNEYLQRWSVIARSYGWLYARS